MAAPVVVSCTAATRRGTERSVNEDAFAADADVGMFLVADGIGGAAGGEIAAAAVIEQLSSAWRGEPIRQAVANYADSYSGDSDSGDSNFGHKKAVSRHVLASAVRKSVLEADRMIVERAEADDLRGMGTTLTGFLVCGGDALFVHAGDSRGYMFRDGTSQQLTLDHSAIPEWRRKSSDQKSRPVLTNALGMGDVTRVAMFFWPLCAGDRFALCTDGVHGPLDENVIGRAATAADLVAVAAAVEGDDDATAVVVKVEQAEGIEPTMRESRLEGLAKSTLFGEMSPNERLRACRVGVFITLEPGAEPPRQVDGEACAYVIAVADSDPDAVGTFLYPEALIDGAALRGKNVDLTGPAAAMVIRRDHFLSLCDDEPDLGVTLFAAVASALAASRR